MNGIMGRRRRQIPAPDELSGIRPVASGKGCLDKKKDVNMYLIYKDSATASVGMGMS